MAVNSALTFFLYELRLNTPRAISIDSKGSFFRPPIVMWRAPTDQRIDGFYSLPLYPRAPTPTAVEVIAVGFKLKCPMPGCSTELQAETKEELMTQGMDHAKVHGITKLSPEMMAMVQGAIKQT